MKLRILISLIAFGIITLGFSFARQAKKQDYFLAVCTLVEANFYRQGEALKKWSEECPSKAERIPLFYSQQSLVEYINLYLGELQVSHLELYTPQLDQHIWRGEGAYTGIKARPIEGRLVIYDVIPASPAAEQGLQRGDIILSLNGNTRLSPWKVESGSGVYKIRRFSQGYLNEPTHLSKLVKAQTMKILRKPRVVKVSEEQALLEIPSFNTMDFNSVEWRDLAQELKRYKRIKVDVRGNTGGSVVAALRVLSSFACEEQLIGYLKRPGKSGMEKVQLEDQFNEVKQLEKHHEEEQVELKTFAGYPCIPGKAEVFVDYATASAAEFFAAGMKQLPKAKILGQSTSGSVVMAAWYDLPFGSTAYSLSIPESIYETSSGEILEGVGVVPDEFLFYDISKAVQGIDNWLE